GGAREVDVASAAADEGSAREGAAREVDAARRACAALAGRARGTAVRTLRRSNRRRRARGRRRLRRGDGRAPRAGAALVLTLPPTVRVFVAVEPLDMRGSFDALAGAVRRLGLDPVDGHL